MAEIENEQIDYLKFKLIVVGDQNTGKSSLINRYAKGTFEENYQATIGIDFLWKTIFIYDQEVRLILYDTAGQEKFRSLIPMYIREAQIILLIYDISNKASFSSIPTWFSQILDVKNDEAVFVLVGNKNDLKDEREVTFAEGKKFADEKNIIFEEVSAKNGNKIDQLFTTKIYEAIYKKFKKKFDDKKAQENNINSNEQVTETINDLKLGKNLNNNKQPIKKKKCC